MVKPCYHDVWLIRVTMTRYLGVTITRYLGVIMTDYLGVTCGRSAHWVKLQRLNFLVEKKKCSEGKHVVN